MLTCDKSNMEINIGKYLRRQSSLARLPQSFLLQVSGKLMQETPFCFKLKFLVEKVKEMH